AVIRFSNPLKGNEASIGLDLLQLPEEGNEVRHVIATGEAHWTGPFALVQGGQALIYRAPIYRSGAEPSRQSFVGLLSVLEDLDGLIARRIEYDAESYGLRVWLTNPTIQGQEARPQLIFGSADGDEAYAGFGGTAQTSGSPDADNDALTVTVEAYPRSIEALDTLPARLQGLLIMVLLLGGGAALVDGSRRQMRSAQQKIHETEAFRAALVEGAGAAIIATDPNGLITLFNPAAEELLGYSAEEVVGKETPQLLHDRDEVIARAGTLSQELGREIEPGFGVFVAKAMEGSPETREWTYWHKDGTRIPVLLTVSAIRNASGEITAFLGVARDITDIKNFQASLQSKDAQLEQMFKGSEAAQILVSRSGGIVDVNDVALSLFGYTREELLELNVDELVPVSYRGHHAQLRESHFAAGCPRRKASARELEACDKNGQVFPIQLGLAHIAGEQQDLVLATIIDLSDIKAGDRARTQFISNISHDLRTPLSVVIGSARMLENAPL
ncbi:PAS domain S-box protein, partial [Altererythrobacter litoralis]|nr:PAS domain S-box protein [Erythrobacteraceae bacterium 1XM1-14]